LIAVGVFKVQSDGITMANSANNRHLALHEKPVEFFDISESGAPERNLLHHLAILTAWNQQQLVMLIAPVLRRHE
jgi:hypothetical protein